MVGLEDLTNKRCNLSLPDERSNRETSRRIGFYSVYLVSLQGLPFTLLFLK